MARPATKLESDEGGGVVVDGSPWSVWNALQDARRDGAESVALWRDRERFDVRTDVQWRIEEFKG